MRSVSVLSAVLLLSLLTLACGSQAPPSGAAPAAVEAVPPPAPPGDPLPPSEQGALARLEKSPRNWASVGTKIVTGAPSGSRCCSRLTNQNVLLRPS